MRVATLTYDPATGMLRADFDHVDWVTYTRAARRFAECAFSDEVGENMRVEGLLFVCEFLSDALACGFHSGAARAEA